MFSRLKHFSFLIPFTLSFSPNRRTCLSQLEPHLSRRPLATKTPPRDSRERKEKKEMLVCVPAIRFKPALDPSISKHATCCLQAILMHRFLCAYLIRLCRFIQFKFNLRVESIKSWSNIGVSSFINMLSEDSFTEDWPQRPRLGQPQSQRPHRPKRRSSSPQAHLNDDIADRSSSSQLVKKVLALWSSAKWCHPISSLLSWITCPCVCVVWVSACSSSVYSMCIECFPWKKKVAGTLCVCVFVAHSWVPCTGKWGLYIVL